MENKPLMLVKDDTKIDCELSLVVECRRAGKTYRYTTEYPKEVVEDRTLSEVGTHFQMQAFESLRVCFADALNERNEVTSQ